MKAAMSAIGPSGHVCRTAECLLLEAKGTPANASQSDDPKREYRLNLA
jgi:hypothetical protein